ncbi:hypothetical protein BASA61_000175 [Batrachochytrium salamandrivorans]|nr:hypothetical protein BASA61_000175 [Batrachochytrium salamandrivorans]
MDSEPAVPLLDFLFRFALEFSVVDLRRRSVGSAAEFFAGVACADARTDIMTRKYSSGSRDNELLESGTTISQFMMRVALNRVQIVLFSVSAGSKVGKVRMPHVSL